MPIADCFGCQGLKTLTQAYALLSGAFPGDKVYPIEWETLTNSVRVHLDGNLDMYWPRLPLTGTNVFMKPPFAKPDHGCDGAK